MVWELYNNKTFETRVVDEDGMSKFTSYPPMMGVGEQIDFNEDYTIRRLE